MNGSSRNQPAAARTFGLSTWLDAPIEAVFAFHEDPRNLEKISPSSLRVIRIDAAPAARVGGSFCVVARQFGLPVRWEGEWLVVEKPGRLVDGARRAPFAWFDHEHRFEADGARTRLTDHVTYSLLGDAWGPLGSLANLFVGWVVLPAMFRARHAATRKWFAKTKSGPT